MHSINEYYLQVTRMRAVYETERLLRVKLVEAGADILDARQSMNLLQDPSTYELMKTDHQAINRFMFQIMAARSINNVLITHLDSVRERGARLKGLIEEKY